MTVKVRPWRLHVKYVINRRDAYSYFSFLVHSPTRLSRTLLANKLPYGSTIWLGKAGVPPESPCGPEMDHCCKLGWFSSYRDTTRVNRKLKC